MHAEGLKEEEQGKGVEIDLVDATVNDEVAQDAEKDQSVYAAGREGEGEQGKAAKGRIRETAGGDQHEPPMELRTATPVDGKREGNGEGAEVHQLDDEEGRRLGIVVALQKEAVHAGGGQVAEDEDADAERQAEPAEGAM